MPAQQSNASVPTAFVVAMLGVLAASVIWGNQSRRYSGVRREVATAFQKQFALSGGELMARLDQMRTADPAVFKDLGERGLVIFTLLEEETASDSGAAQEILEQAKRRWCSENPGFRITDSVTVEGYVCSALPSGPVGVIGNFESPDS